MEYDQSSILSLISHIHTISADFSTSRLPEKDNFVSSHGYILFVLSQNEKMTMGEIAAAINRTKSTTTALIKKLRDAGLIQEEPSPDDSRQKYIFLTDKGREYDKLTSSISRELLSVCYTGFSEKEKNELLHLLKKMSSNIEKESKLV